MKDSKGAYVNLEPKSILFKRLLWVIFSAILFRCFPTSIFRQWRICVLRLFGAKISSEANVYSSAKIQCPWNLTMERLACIGPHAIIENDVMITISEGATISQYSYLCTSSHNICSEGHDLISKPIVIMKNAWVAADSFVGMGVTIGEGAVVGARSSVFNDVEAWNVVGGNPAKFIKKRVIID